MNISMKFRLVNCQISEMICDCHPYVVDSSGIMAQKVSWFNSFLARVLCDLDQQSAKPFGDRKAGILTTRCEDINQPKRWVFTKLHWPQPQRSSDLFIVFIARLTATKVGLPPSNQSQVVTVDVDSFCVSQHPVGIWDCSVAWDAIPCPSIRGFTQWDQTTEVLPSGKLR